MRRYPPPMAENAVRRSLRMRVDSRRLRNFLELNGGIKAFMSRWVTLDDSLDVANAAVICFEDPSEPLFAQQCMYFQFFADYISAMEADDMVVGAMARDDVFQFRVRMCRYTLCRRFNGRRIMWLMTRMDVTPGEQTGSSVRTAGRACESGYGGSHDHPSAR